MKKIKHKNFNPSQMIVLVFMFFITLGTLLLKLPYATTESIRWLDALFTATSAMTVTGLVVVDTGSTYTLFGQLIILLLIQAGGLGIISYAVLIFIMLGKKLGIKQRLVVQQALNQPTLGGIVVLVKRLFFYSIIIETIAMFILAIQWVPEFGWVNGIYYSFFHSISAFNNAGFSIWSDSLTKYVGSPIVNFVISGLFIIGGIGFTVLADIWEKRNFKALGLHSKLMIWGTLGINIIAMFIILVLEYSNPNTLGGLTSINDKIWASYFQAVTPRTAGFNSLDIGLLEEGTITFMIFLMFIGAGSASTGGGIKLTTFLVIVMSIVPLLKQKNRINIGYKSIRGEIIYRSLAIAVLSLLLIFLAIFILTITETASFIKIIFEVVSAFGTVGLSMGITTDLSDLGKILIIALMLFGKIGPLNLAFSIARPKIDRIQYPKEDILTG